MKKSATVLGSVVALATVLGATQASAGVIYDGGAPNFVTAYFADTSYVFTTDAEDFVLQPGGTTVTDAHWWGTCSAAPCPVGDFVIGFNADTAGVPGGLIQQFNVGNANQTATGNDIGGVYPEYAYSATFSSLTLVAGTTYWFTVSNTTNGDGWAMETTGPGSHQQFYTGEPGGIYTPGWNAVDDNLAFNLTSDQVPEPATLLLVGSGLIGLTRLRRRR